MDRKRIAVLPGDGIGPEVIEPAIQILQVVRNDLDFSYFEVGYQRYLTKGEAITDEILEELKQFDAILFGAVSSPPGDVKNYRSAILTLRRELDLYANIRPAKSLIKKNKLDAIIFRENTEGLYSRREYLRDKEAIAEKVVTEEKSERIARIAFDKTKEWGRKKVTIVTKANVLRITDGLFLKVCQRVGKNYPGIETNHMYIDNACYQLAKDPSSFDVIVTMNLYGDILGDLAAGVGDGLGFAPSAEVGERWALFESVHGSAPDIAGQNKANPIATILSAKMMLEYLGLSKEAMIIQQSVERVLEEGKIRTFDSGGTSTTREITEAILAKISAMK